MYKFKLFSVPSKSELHKDTENVFESSIDESEQIGRVIKRGGKLICKAKKGYYRKPKSSSSKNADQKDYSIKDHFNSLKSRAQSAKDTYNYYKDSSNLTPEYNSNMNFVNNSKRALESGDLNEILRSANLDDKAREEEMKKLRRVSTKLQKDSEFMMKHPKLTAIKRAVNEFKDN